MKAIAMFNNKGGIGKTTLTCNLAAFFAKQGKKLYQSMQIRSVIRQFIVSEMNCSQKYIIKKGIYYL